MKSASEWSEYGVVRFIKSFGADDLIVDKTSEMLALMAVDSSGPSQYQESSWSHSGMSYYNVCDLRDCVLVLYLAK